MNSGTLRGSRAPRDELSAAKPRFAHAHPEPPEAPPPLRRLLALAWGYRGVCARIFAGQIASLALGLAALGVIGLAIDVVRAAMDPGGPPPLAAGARGAGRLRRGADADRSRRSCWRSRRCARGRLPHGAAVGKLLHVDLVPELRARVFDKLQRLAFRFFERNASGSIINRVTGDVQSLRSFIDGVLIQSVILMLSLAVVPGLHGWASTSR